MLENEAKGWHGNYSVIGRNIVERFQLLLRKDEIISGKSKKIIVKDGFSTENKDEKSVERKKIKKNIKEIDIFSESFDKQKKEKMKLKEEEKKIKQSDLCASTPKYEFKEKYKFHQSHHGDLKNKLVNNKQNNIKTLAGYTPKMDFIWKKAKAGPNWKLIKGREETNNDDINLNKDIKVKSGKSLITKNKFSKNIKKFDSMDKQTRRGYIPIFYDLRIRTDKAFIPKNKIKLNIKKRYNNNSSELNGTDNSNKKSDYKSLIKNKFSITPKKSKYLNISENNNKGYLNTFTNNFQLTKNNKLLNTDFSRNKVKFLNISKKNLKLLNVRKKIENVNYDFSPIKLDKNILNHTIDFSKILPRDTNFFLTQKSNQTSQPMSNPSYKLIEPRSLTMVSYSKKIKGRSNPKKFIGVDPHLFYDADKVINKINNHKGVNAPNFNIMAGRNLDKGPLPSFMVKLCDRKSLETMTDKGLKMNNYANNDFHINFSDFRPKKSFNKLVNYTLFNNDNEFVEKELKKINNEIFGELKFKKMIEKYSVDESKNKDYSGTIIDGITLKAIKRSEIISRVRNKPLAYKY